MKEQNEHHSFTGMQRDIAISKNPSGFLYDARNIRITQREDDTLIAITNERGTVDLNKFISGKYLGHCLLNNWLVVFSKMDIVPQGTPPDYITRFDLSERDDDDYPKVVLYAGNLHFSSDHLIEAIGSYENESVQKVYWTDGRVKGRGHLPLPLRINLFYFIVNWILLALSDSTTNCPSFISNSL